MKIALDCVKYTFSISKILINSLFVLSGIAIIITAPNFITDYTSAGYMALVTISAVVASVAMINIIFRSKIEVYAPTGSKVKNFSLNFTSNDASTDALQEIIDSGKTDEIRKFKRAETGDIMVEFKYSQDSKFGTYQISKYIPYQYEIITPWKMLGSDCAIKLKELSKL